MIHLPSCQNAQFNWPPRSLDTNDLKRFWANLLNHETIFLEGKWCRRENDSKLFLTILDSKEKGHKTHSLTRLLTFFLTFTIPYNLWDSLARPAVLN